MDIFHGFDLGTPGNASDDLSQSGLNKGRVFHAGIIRQKRRGLWIGHFRESLREFNLLAQGYPFQQIQGGQHMEGSERFP